MSEEAPATPHRDTGPRDFDVKEDWRVGDEVWVRRAVGGATPSLSDETPSSSGYEYYSGIIAFIGSVSFADGDDWVGIRLTGDAAGKGRNDGAVQGMRYFAAPPFSGLFVRTSALRLRVQKSPVRPMLRTPPPAAGRPPRSTPTTTTVDSNSNNNNNADETTPSSVMERGTPTTKSTPEAVLATPPNSTAASAKSMSRQSSKESAGFPDVLGGETETKKTPPAKKNSSNGKTRKAAPQTSAPSPQPVTAPSPASKPTEDSVKPAAAAAAPVAAKPKPAPSKPVPSKQAAKASGAAAAASQAAKSTSTAESRSKVAPAATAATLAAAAVAGPKVSQPSSSTKSKASKQAKPRETNGEPRATPSQSSSGEMFFPPSEQEDIVWTPPPDSGRSARPFINGIHNRRSDEYDDEDKFYWSLSQQRWVRFMLGVAITGLWVLTGLVLGLGLEGTGDDQNDIPTNSTATLYDSIHIHPMATTPASAWLPASLLLLLSIVAGMLRLPLCQTPLQRPVSPLAAYTSRLAAMVTGLASLVMLAYVVVFRFVVSEDDLAKEPSVLHVERWVIWLLADVLMILLPSCVALMLSFYPGEESVVLNEPSARNDLMQQSFESEIVPLLNGNNDEDNENNDQADMEGGNYQLMTDEDDGDEETPPTSRIRGSRRLLQLAASQVLYLYLGCAVLLLRLPFSLAIPHFVSTTLTALANADFGDARREILTLFVCGSIDAFLDFWCIFLFGYANLRIVKRVRLDLFHRLLNFEVAFFDAHHSGSLTSRLNTDCSAMASDLTWFFRFSIESVVRIVGIAGYMLYRSRPLAGCALAIVPAVAIVNKLYGDWLARNAAAVQDALASTQTVAQEALANIRTVISLGAESQMYDSYRERVLKHYNLNVRQTFWQGVYYMVVSTFLINTVVQASLLFFGAYLIQHNRLTADVLLAFMLYQGQLQNETMNLFQSYSSLIKSSGAGDQVFALLDRRTPPPGLGNGTIEEDQDEDASSSLALTLEKVSFRYPSRPEQVVLNGLDLKIAAGKTVALVGSSGSGKSTVLSLIQRLYDPSGGRIIVNGKDLRQKNLVQYRNQIGVVKQDCVLFDGTIYENIIFGHEGRGDESEEVEARVKRAAELANLSDFISTLPLGYETQVGEGGTQLSGGQKQRLAIARAIYREPALLILDEATSSLDAASERLVQEALDRLLAQRKGMTTIIVAHRLQTVQRSDSICVLDQGKIAEKGTHKDLMKKRDGLYYTMVGRAIQKNGVMDH